MYFFSWGKTKKVASEPVELPTDSQLTYGNLLSYGDVCLLDRGKVFDGTKLNSLIKFDEDNGEVVVESGMTIGELLSLIVPKGYFFTVTPGTKYVTIGGATANDVHGKNHHQRGSFGKHIKQIGLIRSDGTRMVCSPSENYDMFYATIGGLGLTGHIEWIKLKLLKIESTNLNVERICFNHLQDFMGLSKQSRSYAYTVAWLDCFPKNGDYRGVFFRANHANDGTLKLQSQRRMKIPFVNVLSILLNRVAIKTYNYLYFYRHYFSHKKYVQSCENFFYPLDSFSNWNQLYGDRGFYQVQFSLPCERFEVLKSILNKISSSSEGGYLVVMKIFGDRLSGGMLSFPSPGVTISVDIPNKKESTSDLIREIYDIVSLANGRVYPAKDMVMTAKQFRAFYLKLSDFKFQKDPGRSSDFWNRIQGEKI